MSNVRLMKHQEDVLKQTENKNRVAYYLDLKWALVKLMLVLKKLLV